MELWDVYDSDRRLTGRVHPRGVKLAAGEYHLVIHACIFNSRGEMLIQKRQPFKSGFSGLWDVTVGGSAIAGESSVMAAERELLEELGISLSLENHPPHFTLRFSQGFDDYFLIRKDISLDTLTLQYEEVETAKYASKEEILSMIEDGSFIPYKPELICLLFSFGDCYGAIRPDDHKG